MMAGSALSRFGGIIREQSNSRQRWLIALVPPMLIYVERSDAVGLRMHT